MRALFFLLLLSNAGFAGWLYYQQQLPASLSPQADTAHSASQPSASRGIVLLSELRSQRLLPSEPVARAAENLPPARQPDKQGVQQRTKADAGGAAPLAAAVTAPPAAVPANGPACYTLGPFRDLETLRVVIRKIRGQVQEASFRSSEEREHSLFWVYLPPEASRDAAKRTTRRLRDKGIRDSYIIAAGKNRLGISLGHFREKSLAYSLRDKVAGLGFEPQVEPVFRSYAIYWLDFRTAPGGRIPDILRQGEMGAAVKRFDRECG